MVKQGEFVAFALKLAASAKTDAKYQPTTEMSIVLEMAERLAAAEEETKSLHTAQVDLLAEVADLKGTVTSNTEAIVNLTKLLKEAGVLK
jgi:hypothetical protein